MAHKTLIGGTAYEISGGKTLIDGTAYRIKNGKTLVDGTAYDIDFLNTITISLPTVITQYSIVTIDGQKYFGALNPNTIVELQLASGTIVECYVHCNNATSGATATISINDDIVAQTNDNVTYNYIVTTDAHIELQQPSLDGTVGKTYGTIKITEH